MSLQPRPPIITIMGHVDHGKTSLLDFIRKSRIAAGEAGGITQHIGAYQIELKGQKMTFIDTPGHAAFNKMRQRGAQITDIVVLVVAANDGVKPQTLESIRFIKESNVAFLVAINKTDLEGVYPDQVKGQLAEQGILASDYGGDIEMIEISAKTGKNIDKLLETIQTMADLKELKADPAAPLEAVVIESTKDARKGSVARVIVKNGTLKIRQDIEAGEVNGRVKMLSNELGQQLTEALPGSPAEVIGLSEAPEVGVVMREAGRDYTASEDEVSALVAESGFATIGSSGGIQGFDASQLDFLLGDKQKLKLLIKADVKGTLEAILQVLDKESIELLSAGVGQITDQDVAFAQTAGALIIAFHIKVPKTLKAQAKSQGVKIKEYDIIYHLIEDLQRQMLKLMEPTIGEVITGEADILQIFEMRGDRIAGVRVRVGEIKHTDKLHLKRGDAIIADPTIKSIKHGKDDILVIKTKNEAGITFRNKKLDFMVGDILVAYTDEDEIEDMQA
jgi:translation initiation factor IF-2